MAARPTLAVGARRTSGGPALMGSAILWDINTGLSTTDAHVILDCGTSNGVLDPETHGVALGVGSADADIVWLWIARIVNISYPPSNKPLWPAKIASWSFTIAPGRPKLDLAVLQVQGHLNGGRSMPLNESPFADVQSLGQSFADHGLEAVPLGDSDLAPVEEAVRVYGFGQSDSHRTQRAMITRGIISRKTDQAITIDAAMLGGHSGGMLLDSAGEVIGWCVWSQTNNWSQTDRVFGSGSLSAPSGVNDVRPINLLRPALEAALVAIDPSRTGVALTEKLRGAAPHRPVQDQASTAAQATQSKVQDQLQAVQVQAQAQAAGAVEIARIDSEAARQKEQAAREVYRVTQQALGLSSTGGHGLHLALQEPGELAVAASTAMGLSQVSAAAAMTSLPPDGIALEADNQKRQRYRSLPQDVAELSLAAPLLDGVPNLPEQCAPRPVLEAEHRDALDAEEFEYEETPWDSEEEEGEDAAAVVVPPQPEFTTGTLLDGRRFAVVFCSPKIGRLAYKVEAQQMMYTDVLSSDASLGQGATLHAVEKLMRDFDPHILWFVGHVNAGENTLCWTTDSGGVVLIDARVCSAVLSAHTPKRGGSLECVVLNACETMKDGAALGLCAASTQTGSPLTRARMHSRTHCPSDPQSAS